MQRCQGHRGSGRRQQGLRRASHGVLSGPAIDRLESSNIEELALLDTIPAHPEAVRARIKYLSVASMFSEAIERTYQEVSISKLFR